MTGRPYLNDRQRVEIAIPCTLWYALVVGGYFTPNPDLPEETRETEMRAKLRILNDLMKTAAFETVEDLPPKHRRKLNARISRETSAAAKELDGASGIKLALVFFYFTKALTDSGVLELWEGSAMGQAMNMLFPMFEYSFDEEIQDRSAQKQATRLIKKFQDAGFYRGAVLEVAA